MNHGAADALTAHITPAATPTGDAPAAGTSVRMPEEAGKDVEGEQTEEREVGVQAEDGGGATARCRGCREAVTGTHQGCKRESAYRLRCTKVERRSLTPKARKRRAI
jgi:hypothetical protein